MLGIDWQQAWFQPWAQWGKQVQQHWTLAPEQLHQALNHALNQSLPSPADTMAEATAASVDSLYAPSSLHPDSAVANQGLRFVPQQDLSADCAYESFISQHQRIPTRNNAHDFFNGLCWLRFPKTKTLLNRLQAQTIASEGVGARRGALRDALTLFDESAGLLFAPPSLWSSLHNKQWHELFITHRDDWRHTQLVLFGHALLEKLMNPYKSITAHIVCVPMPALTKDEEIDAWLCQQLTPTFLTTKPFVPLPLSGIPGWWMDNHVPDFYEDKKVFRD